MKWYKKVLFWELHRIPLNIIITGMIVLGAYIFHPYITKAGEEEPEMMFYSLLIYLILFFFNILYTFTWIISLFLNLNNFKYSKYFLLSIYFICFLSFFTLPIVYLWLTR